MTNPLRKWMDKNDRSETWVADKLGCSQSRVNRLIQGVVSADAATLARISALTGCDVTPNLWVAWDSDRRKMLSPPRPKTRKKTAA